MIPRIVLGEDGPQKGFRVTATGELGLARWLRTPPDLSSPPRDELVGKVLVAFRLPGTGPPASSGPLPRPGRTELTGWTERLYQFERRCPAQTGNEGER